MPDALVTGATGLLGARVVPRLAETHDVVAVARRSPANRGRARWIVHDLAQPSLYVATKLAAEVLADAHRALFTVIVLRPFFIYGRAQDRCMLLPRLVDSIRCGRAITLAGRDGMRFNPVHVEDAARAVVAAT